MKKYADVAAGLAYGRQNFQRAQYAEPRMMGLPVTARGVAVASAPELSKFAIGGIEEMQSKALEMAKNRDLLTDLQRRQWLIDNATDGHGHLGVAVAAAVYEHVYNDVLPQTWAADLFEMRNLANDEYPGLALEQRQFNLGVVTIGPDGGVRSHAKQEFRQDMIYEVEYLMTDKVAYRLMDIQTGQVTKIDALERALATEWDVKLHDNALAGLAKLKKTSGLRATLHKHPRVVAASIPDKNYYDFSTAGGTADALDATAMPTITKMKKILMHYKRLAGNAVIENDGTSLALKSIYINTQDIEGIWNMVDVVSTYSGSATGVVLPADAVTDSRATVTQEIRQAVFKDGTLRELFGEKFNLIPLNTITAGTFFCSSNKPCGVWFWKPGFKQTYDSDDETTAKNERTLGYGTPQVLTIPNVWAYRYLSGKW